MILRNPGGNNDVEWCRCFIIFPLMEDDVARWRANTAHLARRVSGAKVPDLAQDDLSQSGLLAPPHQRYGYPFPS